MKLETFITNFNTDGSKEKCVKGIMRSEYVPYTTKCGDCMRILDACHYKEVDGKRRFSMNSPAQAMLFALNLIMRYTKIEFDPSVNAYDDLCSCGALKMIVDQIPAAESQEYSAIMRMCEDDLVAKETDLASRFDDFRQAISRFVDVYADQLMAAALSAAEEEESHGQE